MRLTQTNQRTLITEGWNDPRLTLLETKYIIPFVRDVERYIVEAQLTPDQINQLFTNVEQGATAAGSNRTLVGKGKDAASFINKKIDELGAQLKKAGPVQNADAKFAELKAKIGATDSKVVKGIQAVSDWAKANPGKASVAVGILTAAAAMAGGPLGGAVAGFLARATKDLLQGSELSTAVGKSVKTAVVGFLAGNVFKFLSDEMKDFFTSSTEADLKAASDALVNAKVQNLTQAVEAKYGEAADLWNEAFPDGNYKVNVNVSGTGGSYFSGDVILTKAQALEYNQLIKAANESRDIFSEQGRQAMAKTYAFLEQVKATTDQSALATINAQGIEALNAIRAAGEAALEDPELKSQIAKLSGDAAKDIAIMKDIADLAAAAGQGAVQARPDKGKSATESIIFKPIQIETIIEWCDETPAVVLIEGPLDAIGGALKKGAAAIGAKAKTVGKNITTKVTADKLASAWKKAGSPTDSDAIANILRQQGVSDTVLAPVYKTMGAKLPAAPVAADPKQPAAGQQSTQPTAQKSTQPTARTADPKQPAAGQQSTQPTAGTADFKSLQKTVANLNAQDATTLVTYIDSLPSTGAAPATPKGTTAASKPAAGQAPAAQPGVAGAASTKNAAAGDTYEKAKSDVRKVQSGTKPIPPKAAADIQSAIAKLAKGDKESGVFAAQKIMNLAQAGVDISKQQQSWVANSKAGERFLTQSVYFEISKMLKEHNLSWSDLGIRVHLLENTNKLFGISVK